MNRENLFTVLMILIVSAAAIFMLSGCSMNTKDPMAKVADLDYTVLAVENIPEEVLKETEQRKEDAFKLTFRDGENLYVCMGYGRQKSGGYSIRVLDFYEAENGIYVSAQLLGPGVEERKKEDGPGTCPYVVMKTEYREKPVIFL